MQCTVFNEDDPTDLTQAIRAVRSMEGRRWHTSSPVRLSELGKDDQGTFCTNSLLWGV